LPHYDFADLLKLRDTLRNELGDQRPESGCGGAGGGTTIVRSPSGNMDSEAEGENSDSCITPRQSSRARSVSCDEVPSVRGGELATTIVRSPQGIRLNYQERVEECRRTDNTLLKTSRFLWSYAVHLGRVPSVEEAINEYLRQGLNTSPEVHRKSRYQRFKQAIRFLAGRFNPEGTHVCYDDWGTQKDDIVKAVEARIGRSDLAWSNGKNKRNRLTVEDLAAVYYAIRKSNDADSAREASLRTNSFSYEQAKSACQIILGKKCHRAKISRILALLREMNLIEKIDDHIIGLKGAGYRALDFRNRI